MITISFLAAEKIIAQSKDKSKDPIIRIGVRGGGCSGFQLFLEWGKKESSDKVFELNGATVVVDPKSYIFLEGSTVDYKTSFMENGFKITSPRQTGQCGCGESVEF